MCIEYMKTINIIGNVASGSYQIKYEDKSLYVSKSSRENKYTENKIEKPEVFCAN
jgi:hypothetical protein